MVCSDCGRDDEDDDLHGSYVTHLKCFCLTGKVSVACDVSSPETGDLVT